MEISPSNISHPFAFILSGYILLNLWVDDMSIVSVSVSGADSVLL